MKYETFVLLLCGFSVGFGVGVLLVPVRDYIHDCVDGFRHFYTKERLKAEMRVRNPELYDQIYGKH